MNAKHVAEPSMAEIMQIISAKPEHISPRMVALIDVACAETRRRLEKLPSKG